jgi:hypothetical protein
MTRLIPIALITALVLGACAIPPLTYSAKPTTGRVVDASTREPVGNAVVVAMWDLEGGMERSTVANFKVFEAVTDSAGHFKIEGWGPEPVPTAGTLDKQDPSVIIFKPGYVPKVFPNTPYPLHREREALEQHNWLSNGETLEVEKSTGPFRYYVPKVEGLYSTFYNVLNNGSRCDWKRIPRTIRFMEDQEKKAEAQGIRTLFHVSAKELMERKQCAPFDAFDRSYSEVY